MYIKDFNSKKVEKVFIEFYEKIKNEEFYLDKTGQKFVEILGFQIRLKPKFFLNINNLKKTNIKYVKKELRWYLKQSLNIFDGVGDIKIWQEVCSKEPKGFINSNYGWMIFSKENFQQFNNVLNELLNNPFSRRGVMIYLRPSMWEEYSKNGMNDFVCTWGTNSFIRNNKLYMIVNQRSCDFIFGFFNDFAWHCFVYNKLYRSLKKKKYHSLEKGEIIYNCDSLHLYERHFNLAEKIYKASNILSKHLENQNGEKKNE